MRHTGVRHTSGLIFASMLVVLACSGAPPTVDGGTRLDGGSLAADAGQRDGGTDASVIDDAGVPDAAVRIDAGPIDAGCLQMPLADGGCVALSLSQLCWLSSVTVLQTGVAVDDRSATSIGLALTTSCSPPPARRTVDVRDGGVLDSNGAPLVDRSEVFVVAGGSHSHPYVRWFETSGLAPVIDSSVGTTASFSNRAGVVLISEPLASLGPALDYFVVELVRSTPGGPLSLIAYGFYGPGTAAAAWYVEQRVLPALPASTDSWAVVRWSDGDGDTQPGAADQFIVIASGQ